jgi:beta-N-acetylglucosaminidase
MSGVTDWDGAAYLRTRHTRVLMKMRESAYRCGGYNYATDEERTDAEIFYDPFDTQLHYVSLAQIKAELATREHVPNKREARAIRQERARRK